MDITTVATLAMFGSAFAGGLVGLLVGKITRFEIGLMIGLVIFGAVTLYFSARCFVEYRAFATAGTNAVWGEVVAIIDKPSNESGSITSPALIVRFSAPDGAVHEIEGPTASSARIGEHVMVIVDRVDPRRSRIGQLSELRGGAIAFMLFGTFPMSFALMLLAGLVEDRRRLAKAGSAVQTSGVRSVRSGALQKRRPVVSNGVQKKGISGRTAKALFIGLAASIAWIAVPGEDLLLRFAQGFAGVAVSLIGYALLGWRAGLMWTVGVSMLALNFGVWSFAVYLLS